MNKATTGRWIDCVTALDRAQMAPDTTSRATLLASAIIPILDVLADPANTTPEAYTEHLRKLHTDITLRLAAMDAMEPEPTCGGCEHWESGSWNRAIGNCMNTNSPCCVRMTKHDFYCNKYQPKDDKP